MAFTPWLCLDSVEIINSQRVLTYLKGCLCGGWEIFGPTGYDSDDPRGLECYCSATAAASYISPEADPAPWYVASRPESADFLGIWSEVEVSPVLRRATNDLADGGAVVGPLVPKARIIAVDGLMLASSEAGMRYGERWLTEALAGVQVGCEGMVADILPWCDEDAFQQCLGVGITDAPDPVPQKSHDGCFVSRVTFALTAGNPFLFSRGEVCQEVTLAPGEDTCCFIETDEWPGDVVLKVEVANNSAGAVGPVDLSLTPTAGDTCPATGPPYASMEITGIESGGAVTIDGRTETVDAYDVLSRAHRPNLGVISFVGVPRWPVVGPCMKACMCVANSGDSPGSADVTITKYTREL